MKNALFALVGVLFGFILTSIFMPNWQNMMTGSHNGWGANQTMRSTDSHFIEQMIPHHEDAILMADLALLKAKHPEIKALAQDIKKAQNDEINQMKSWYKDWFGKDVPDTFLGTTHGMGMGQMHMGKMGDATDISTLEKAVDFDKAFIEEMIPHHQMAVMMAQMLASSTNRPEMKKLAQDIIEAQSREIASMREWYRQWYGK